MGNHVGHHIANVVFPRYPLRERDELPEVLDLFRRDLWNSVGEDIETNGRSISIEVGRISAKRDCCRCHLR